MNAIKAYFQQDILKMLNVSLKRATQTERLASKVTGLNQVIPDTASELPKNIRDKKKFIFNPHSFLCLRTSDESARRC